MCWTTPAPPPRPSTRAMRYGNLHLHHRQQRRRRRQRSHQHPHHKHHGANDGPTGISAVPNVDFADITNDTKAIGFATLADTSGIDYQVARDGSFVVSDVDDNAVLIVDADNNGTFNSADVTAIRAAATFVWSNGSGVLGTSTGVTAGPNPTPNTGGIPTSLSLDDRADILTLSTYRA